MKKDFLATCVMKNAIVLFTLMCVFTLMISCSSESDELDSKLPDEPNKVAEMIDVKLGFGGDPISISENPLTRAEDKKKVYGINVYYREGSSSYQHYAYGLFDNIGDMKISLISKYNYKFECTIVQDDKDELYVDNNGSYSYPFYRKYGYNTKLENKFIVSTTSSDYLSEMKYGQSRVKNGSSYKETSYPRTDRLYGELTNYTPTDGGTAVINMKRTVFGANFVINPPADGTLELGMSPFFSKTISSTDATQTIDEVIYTFSDVYACWQQQEDYTRDFTLNLTWKRANGATQYFSKTITMKRNVMTTVNISVSGSTGDSSVGFNEENTQMSSATVNATFNGGSSNDNNVDPQ